MNKAIKTVAAVVLTLVVNGRVEAGSKGSYSSSHSYSGGRDHGGNHYRGYRDSHHYDHSYGNRNRDSHHYDRSYGYRTRPFRESYRGYHLSHGTRFEHGYYFSGRLHKHWTKRYWHNAYGCYVYYCPSTKCEYYWCLPDNRYYPVSYVPYKTRKFKADNKYDGFEEENASRSR